MDERPPSGDPEAGARAPDLIARAPTILLAGALLGWGLYALLPLSFPNDAACVRIGLFFLSAGLIVAMLTVREFHRWKTAYMPGRKVTWLIRSGPFRYSRNPLYLAMAVAYFGAAMIANNGWMLLLLIPSVTLITHTVIKREERFLERSFGEDYRRYRGSVPRWLIH